MVNWIRYKYYRWSVRRGIRVLDRLMVPKG